MLFQRFFALAFVFVLVSCVAPISVERVKPEVPAALASAAVPKDMGSLLDLIAASEKRLNGSDPASYRNYNFLVARLIDAVEESGLEPWNQPIAVRGAKGVYRFSANEPDEFRGLSQQLVPTDRLVFSGDYAVPDSPRVDGVGAPIVINLPDAAAAAEQSPFFPAYRAMTAVVEVKGNQAELRFLDPFLTENVSLNGRSRVLSADYDSAFSYSLSKTRIDKLGIVRMLNPSRYADTAELSFIQPYDPERIPVLFVHGLQSTPATWTPMYIELMRDPEIRKKYQFWVFSYPSGYPFPYSAALLRQNMDEVARVHPNHKKVVIVGHSMGGLLSRLMISDAGDSMWIEFFGRPPQDTPIDRKSRRILEDSLVFDSRTDISRAVFFAAPHRGTDLASKWIGRLLSRLVRVPDFLADTRNAVINIVTVDAAALQLDRAPNSIDTLAPNNRFVRETSKLPRRADVPVHSIMGDRGRGNSPNSTDGIVPYWSAHLENQTSEKIVPSGHSAHQHPEGIAELRRILRLHAGEEQ